MNALPKLLKLSLLPLLAASLHAANTYQVKPGDTLSSIARKNGTTPAKLMSANGISNPNLLKVGQTLKVSGSAPAPKKKAATTRRQSTGSGNYTIKPGETLYSIARKNGVSVSALTAMNPGLDPSKLSVGQKIKTSGAPAAKKKATPPAPKKKAPVIAKKTIKKSTPKPAPIKKVVKQNAIKKGAKPAVTLEAINRPASRVASVPAPIPNFTAPKPAPVQEAIKKASEPQPSSISSVMVRKEISFGALASRHRTSTQQLNELNGWRLKPTTILAKGSEVYVPGI